METTKLQTVKESTPVDYARDSEMAVMDHSGDTKVVWSRDNPADVDAARDQFAAYRKKGFAAFKVVGKTGEKGEQMHEFDPTAERIIFVPPMVGG